MNAEQIGDIVLNPKTRLGGAGKIDPLQSRTEFVSGEGILEVTSSEDKKLHTLTSNGTAGDVVINVIADKDLSEGEDQEIGEWHITVTAAGTTAVPMELGNLRDREA